MVITPVVLLMFQPVGDETIMPVIDDNESVCDLDDQTRLVLSKVGTGIRVSSFMYNHAGDVPAPEDQL